MKFDIKKIESKISEKLQKKIDTKTKPLGSLGELENIALKTGCIQNTINPKLINPHILVFAGDHGIAQEGVSAYPAEVTPQMVLNFINGGAAINVFCEQNQMNLTVIDSGVNYDFDKNITLEHLKINKGTKNFLIEPAMSGEELNLAVERGAKLIEKINQAGCNVAGFGEMGIGNTTSAAAVMSVLTGLPVHECAGKGTGLSGEGLKHKINVIEKSIQARNAKTSDAFEVMRILGGFEMAMMMGAMLKAAELKMILLIDGFISSSVFLAANKVYPEILDYAVFCHQSDENGHGNLLKYLNAEPLLKLNMRLGEGTGCALAYPVIQSAILFLNEMASFESAGVSNRD
ncbi:MAG: nicotinate-nucleotide--dimethylbenzimidazole phosphoribosyltransferase [Spirochaetia bacterium]|nr:nicotinate-nucleotide--dimethylbenzimidazole phosphoribosyltransferase [Spirochaetia bacterium]